MEPENVAAFMQKKIAEQTEIFARPTIVRKALGKEKTEFCFMQE